MACNLSDAFVLLINLVQTTITAVAHTVSLTSMLLTIPNDPVVSSCTITTLLMAHPIQANESGMATVAHNVQPNI